MNINDDGTITDIDLVDGVDLSAFADDVADHHGDHGVGGNLDSKSETVYGPSDTFKTSSDGTDDTATWEGATVSPNPRSHHHASGTYATNSTTLGTGITPTGGYVDVTDNGDVECKTVDGVCPKDLHEKYRLHKHGLTGNSESVTPSAISMVGNSGRTYFHVSNSSDGSSPYWASGIQTDTAPHSHGVGSLEMAAPGGTAPSASGSYVDLDADNNRIVLNGNVNDVDVDAFKTRYDTNAGGSHQHQGSGSSGLGGGTSSLMRAGGTAVYFETSSGWKQITVYVNSAGGAQHNHAATGLYTTI